MKKSVNTPKEDSTEEFADRQNLCGDKLSVLKKELPYSDKSEDVVKRGTSAKKKRRVKKAATSLESASENADSQIVLLPTFTLSEKANSPISSENSDFEEEKSAREILEKFAPLAAKTIIDMMLSDSSSNSLKADCAKEILTRLYGKTFTEEGEVDISEGIIDAVKKFCV